MFEKLVSNLLTRVLGKYIQNLNSDKLKLAVFGGRLDLKDLELRKDALDFLHPAIAVKRGHVGRLQANISWSKLASEPVTIQLSDVFVLAAPKTEVNYDPEYLKQSSERAFAKKRKQLKALEDKKWGAPAEKSEAGKISRLVTKIIDNLQIVIENIHVRYEDFSDPNRPFAGGVILKALKAESTDEHWTPTYISENPGVGFKVAKLIGFSIYMNPFPSDRVSKLKSDQFTRVMHRLIGDATGPSSHHFLLRDLNATAQVKLSKDAANLSLPRMALTIKLDSINIEMDSQQFLITMRQLDYWVNFGSLSKYQKHRPPGRPEKGTASLWWQYAYTAITAEARDKKGRMCSLSDLVQRRRDREAYIAAYKKKLTPWTPELTPVEEYTFDDIEDRRPISELIYFRTLARAVLDQECKKTNRTLEVPKQEKKGAVSRFMGWKNKKEEEEDVPDYKLSAEEEAALRRAVGYQQSEEETREIMLPRDYVKTHLSFTFDKISMALFDANQRGDGSWSRTAMVQAVLSGLVTNILLRKKNVAVAAYLQDAKVIDQIAQQGRGGLVGQFPYMLQRVAPAAYDTMSEKARGLDFLLSLKLDLNPLDEHCDMVVKADLQGTEIVYSPLTLEKVMSFFDTKSSTRLTGLEAVSRKAKHRWKNLQKNTTRSLQEAYKHHQTIDLRINLTAPTVLVPEDPFSTSMSLLVVDLGSLNVRSNLFDMIARKRIEEQLQEGVDSELRASMYDRYHVRMYGAQAHIFSAQDSWRSKLKLAAEEQEVSSRLLAPTEIRVDVANCIIADDSSLTPVKLKAEMKRVDLRVTSKNLITLGSILARLTAKKAENEDEEEKGEESDSLSSSSEELFDLVHPLEEEAEDFSDYPRDYRKIDCQIDMEGLAVSLLWNSADAASTEMPLAMASVKGLHGSIGVGVWQTDVQVGLESVSVVDMFSPSRNEPGAGSVWTTVGGLDYTLVRSIQGADGVLAKVSLLMTSRDCPWYDDVDQTVDVALSGVEFTLRRLCLFSLIDFADVMSKSLSPQPAARPPKPGAAHPAMLRRQTTVADLNPAVSVEDLVTPPVQDALKTSAADGVVKTRVRASLATLQASLVQGRSLFAKSTLEKVDVLVEVRSRRTDITCSLQSFRIEGGLAGDPSNSVIMQPLDEASAVPDTIDGSIMDTTALLSGRVALLDPKSPSYRGFVTVIQAKLARLRVNYVQSWLMGVIDYLSQSDRVKKLAAKTADRVKKKASDTAQRLQNEAPQSLNLLSISVDSPLFVIPRGRFHTDRFVCDLGHLEISNKLMHKQGETLERTSILLRQLSMQSMAAGVPEDPIINNADLKVLLDRPLAPDTLRPRMATKVKFSTLDACLSQGQYALLMATLAENFGEQLDVEDLQEEPLSKPDSEADGGQTEDDKSEAKGDEEFVLYTPPPVREKAILSQVSVKIPRVSLSLVNEAVTPEGVLETMPLTRVSLESLVFVSKTMADRTGLMSFSMESLALLDERKDAGNAFPLLLASISGEDSSQLRGALKSSADGEREIEISFSGFRLFAVDSAIRDIMEFFTEMQQQDDASKGAKSIPKGNGQEVTVQETSAPVDKKLRFAAKMNTLELWLLHDASDPSTRGVVVNCPAEFAYETWTELPSLEESSGATGAPLSCKRMDFAVHGFTVGACQPKLGLEQMGVPLIRPFEVLVAVRTLPDNSTACGISTNTKIVTSDLAASVSYQDIMLMKDIVGTLTSIMAEKETEDTAAVPAPALLGSSTETETVDTAEDVSAGSPAAPAEAAVPTTLKATLATFHLLLVDDSEGNEMPFVELGLNQCHVKAKNNREYNIHFSLWSNYFSVTRGCFEPWIEPWNASITYITGENPKSTLLVTSESWLNFNISPDFVATVASTLRSVKADADSESRARRSDSHPFTVHNLTGSEVRFRVNTPGSEQGWMSVEEGESLGFSKRLSVKRFRGSEMSEVASCPIEAKFLLSVGEVTEDEEPESIMLGDTSAGIINVTISEPECIEEKMQFPDRSTTLPVFPVVCDTQIRCRNRVLVLHGTRSLFNDTAVPLDIKIMGDSCVTGNRVAVDFSPVGKGARIYVPCGLCGVIEACAKPCGNAFLWSETLALTASHAGEPIRVPSFLECPPPRGAVHAHAINLCVHVEKENSCLDFRLMPPYVLENALPYTVQYRVMDDGPSSLCPDRLVRKVTVNKVETFSGVVMSGKSIDLYELSPYVSAKIAMSVEGAGYGMGSFVRLTPGRHNVAVPEFANLPTLDNKQISLGLHNRITLSVSRKVTVYSPYQIVNNTGLRFLYKTVSATSHVPPGQSPTGVKGSDPFLLGFMESAFGEKIQLRPENGNWSRPWSISALGTSGTLACTKAAGSIQQLKYETAVQIALAPEPFRRTTVVTIDDRFVLRNKLGRGLIVKVANSEKRDFLPVMLMAGKTVPLGWFSENNTSALFLQVRSEEEGFQWTNSFSVTDVGVFTIRMDSADRSQTEFIQVAVKLVGATLKIVFTEHDRRYPPFRLVNRCSQDLHFCQRGTMMPMYVLHPNTPLDYAFDNLKAAPVLLVQANQVKEHLSISKIKRHRLLKLGGLFVRPNVFADGPTRVVSFDEEPLAGKKGFKYIYDRDGRAHIEKNVPKGKKRKEKEEDEVVETDPTETINMCLRFSLHGIGFSFIDATMKEILYISAKQVTVDIDDTLADRRTTVALQEFQIDDQAHDSIFPVVFARMPLSRDAALERKPMLHFAMVRKTNTDKSQRLIHFKYLSLLLQSIQFKISEQFLISCLQLAKDLDFNAITEAVSAGAPSAAEVSETGEPSSLPEQIFIEYLALQPMRCGVSLSIGGSRSLFLKEDDYDEHQLRGRSNVRMSTHAFGAIKALVNAAGVTLGNINDGQLKFNALFIENAFTTQEALSARVVTHMKNQAIRQALALIGSFEFLGNPAGLFSKVGTGVKDLFYEPYQGLTSGPEDLGKGIIKGAKSFSTGVVSGLTGTAGSIAGTLGKGFGQLTFDDEYQRERAELQRQKPTSLVEGVGQGFTQLGGSILGAGKGLIMDPVKGAKKSGGVGLFKGLGKGVIGVVAKTGAGVFDMAAKVGQGVQGEVEDTVANARVRAPRVCHATLKPYDHVFANANTIVRQLHKAKYRSETLSSFTRTSGATKFLFATENRVLCADAAKMEVEWKAHFKNVASIRAVQPNRLVVLLNRPKKRGAVWSSGKQSYEVACKNYETAREAAHDLRVPFGSFRRSLPVERAPGAAFVGAPSASGIGADNEWVIVSKDDVNMPAV